MVRMKGKQALMEMLRAEGVRYVFGNPGTTELPLLDALQDYPDVKYITVLQEAVAVGIADGYARATGSPAFVNVHITVGLANALSLLYNAYKGGTPMVITAGQLDTRLLLHDATLWSDMAGTLRNYTKWSAEVLHTQDLPMLLRRAFRVARTPPTGPVFLSIPWNVLDEEADVELVPASPGYHRVRPDPEALERAVDLLSKAENPLIFVGDRVAQSQAVEEAVAVAELVGARVYAGFGSYSEVNFPTGHPQFLGSLYLSWPTRALKRLLNSADVIVAIGAPLISQFVYAPEPLIDPGVKILHLDSSPWEIEKRLPVTVGVWADLKMSLKELAEALSQEMSATARESARTRAAAVAQEKRRQQEAFQQQVREYWDNEPISVERLMVELRNAMPPNAIVADEAVSSRRALLNAIEFNRPGDYFSIRGGALGWGVPAPIGLKLANPGRPVVAVVGDGSAMYTVQALWTAVRYNIPVVYIICNNRSYKVLKEGMLRYLAGTGRESQFVGMEFYESPLNLAKLAEGFGLLGLRVERPQELRPALERAFAQDGPALVDVVIEERVRKEALQEEWLAWQRG